MLVRAADGSLAPQGAWRRLAGSFPGCSTRSNIHRGVGEEELRTAVKIGEGAAVAATSGNHLSNTSVSFMRWTVSPRSILGVWGVFFAERGQLKMGMMS